MVVDCHALRARNDEWIATPFGLAMTNGLPRSLRSLAMTAFRHREGPTGPWRSISRGLPRRLRLLAMTAFRHRERREAIHRTCNDELT